MKTKNQLAAIAFSLLSAISFQHSAFAQGGLTPPGAPAPLFKTLAQIDAKLDPRTPISSAPFTITNSGSYYLTTNLTVSSGNAITIATNGVTLDLGGFTLSSTEASPAGTGILLTGGLRNITLANGFIQGGVTNNGSGVYSGSGFGYGIYYSGIVPVNVLVSRIAVSGCLYYGIYVNIGDSTVVESCMVRTVGSYGIFASTIKQSSAIDCGSIAIYGEQVSDCRGKSTGAFAVYATTALNCYGTSSTSYGVYVTTIAQNCYGESGNGTGVNATTALNCHGSSGSSGTGVFATTAQNCYGQSGSSGVGVNATTALNCYGSSGSSYGVYATTAQNCYGYSGSSYGVYAIDIAIGCSGYSYSGTGLYAFIANVCRGETTSGTALSTPHNVNSF